MRYYVGLYIKQTTFRSLKGKNKSGISVEWGTSVAQWLRCYATNRKVAGSIPAGVIGFFIDIILPIALWPWGRLSL